MLFFSVDFFFKILFQMHWYVMCYILHDEGGILSTITLIFIYYRNVCLFLLAKKNQNIVDRYRSCIEF